MATLNDIRLQRGVPKFLFCDNGSEFTSQMMDLWTYHNRVRIDFLAAKEADRQRTRGVVQRHAARRVLGRALVRDADRGQASDRVLEARKQ